MEVLLQLKKKWKCVVPRERSKLRRYKLRRFEESGIINYQINRLLI